MHTYRYDQATALIWTGRSTPGRRHFGEYGRCSFPGDRRHTVGRPRYGACQLNNAERLIGLENAMRNWIMVCIISFWVLIVGYKLFNPAEAEGKSFFQNLSTAKVEWVEFESPGSATSAMSTRKVVDQQKLEQFFDAWRGADTIIPNHPRQLWAIRVRFNTSKGVYGGTLSATSNQGVLFTFNQSPSGWPVSAIYQLVGPPERMDRVLQATADTRR
jgi:hypothetical protein